MMKKITTKTKIVKYFTVLVLAFSLLITGCASQEQGKQDPTASDKLIPVTVMLDWSPNTNHTGLFVAKDQGLFENEGLDVEIVQPSSQGTAEQLVGTNKIEFGVSAQEQVTYARAQNIPVVSLAAILQHNTSGFASLKEKNITSAKDFEGKAYGGWGLPSEEATIKALMEKENADFSKVSILNIGESDQVASLTQGDINFVWIFYAWTGIQAELNKKELNMIWLKDVEPALDYYTPVIITGEEMIKNKPDIVQKFIKAVSEGYMYAEQNPAEAADILINNTPETDPALIRKSQEWISKEYRADAEQWGIQKPEVWENYAKWLYDNKLIETIIDTDQAFTNDFLPK